MSCNVTMLHAVLYHGVIVGYVPTNQSANRAGTSDRGVMSVDIQLFHQKLSELHSFLNQTCVPVNHTPCEIDGHHDSITTYQIGDKRLSITMHDGVVAGIVYR